jgi:hypothetical protein
MRTPLPFLRRAACALLVLVTAARAAAISAEAQAAIDAQFQEIAGWAADPELVADVRAHNAATPPEETALTQEQWHNLTVLDPLVRRFTRSPSGQLLKSKRSALVTEAFVSDAKGLKVGFIAKTSNWSHAGKPKHDQPMSGKNWQGPIEIDESAGLRQLQISVPVRDGNQVIGSLVVGLNVTQLAP